jgi:hypothetical protein
MKLTGTGKDQIGTSKEEEIVVVHHFINTSKRMPG